MLSFHHDAHYQKLVEQEGELWAEHNIEIRYNWFHSPMIYRYINRLISGAPHRDWLDYVKERYLTKPAALGLTAGCGHGESERLLLQRGIAQRMEAFDISPKAIDAAKNHAQESGFGDQVRYFVGDANYLEKAPLSPSYDVIFGIMSLHHFMHLESCLDRLHERLKPNGYFIANEFIGPDRFQWSEAQLEAANRLLDCFPLELKRIVHYEKEFKTRIVRPTLEYMKEYQAFEAVCSGRILQAIDDRFEVIEIGYYGGTILHLLFDGIMNNFKEERNREHAIMVRMAIEAEHMLLEHQALPHDHALIIAQKI